MGSPPIRIGFPTGRRIQSAPIATRTPTCPHVPPPRCPRHRSHAVLQAHWRPAVCPAHRPLWHEGCETPPMTYVHGKRRFSALLTASMLVLATFGALTAARPAQAAPAAAAVPTGPVLDRIRQTGKILIAHRESSVPFSYLDADKKPMGYAVDLCLKLAEAVRKRLEMKALAPEFVLVTAGNRIQMVVDGKADLECGSTTNNAERRQKVAFTIPHYITGARYMVLADSKGEDLANFEHKKLVSTKGTTPLTAIHQAHRERLLGIQILEAPDHARAVEMVEQGEA